MTARDVIEEVLDIRCEGYDRNTADAILAALDAAGYAVVPKEPTEKMYIATCDAWECHGSGFDQFKREYGAMLKAAKETTSQAAGGGE